MAKFLGLAEQSVHIVPYAPPHGGFRHHHLCLNDTRFADQAFEQECGGPGRLDRFREEQAKSGKRLKVSPFPESNSILADVVAL